MAPLTLPDTKPNVQRLAKQVPICPEIFGFIPTAQLSAWVGADLALLGWGQNFSVTEEGEDALKHADVLWQEATAQAVAAEGLPVHLPVAFGSFGFTRGGVLEVPENLLVATASETWLISLSGQDLRPLFAPWAATPAEFRQEGAARLAQLPTLGTLTEGEGALPGAEWAQAVARVSEQIRHGEAKKVVLARDKTIATANPIDQRKLCAALFAAYPTCWVYAVENLVGATPELLASTTGGRLFCRVLAGTAGPTETRQLLDSAKDQREHQVAVESVRTALAPITTELDIPDSPSILQLPNVCHLATDVHGSTDRSALAAAGALHPTAAVCGTPTPVARQILTAAEHMERGRYAGPVGWADAAGNGAFGIALRGGQISADARQIRIYAGAGIMGDSVPQIELAETEAKMAPMMQALRSIS